MKELREDLEEAGRRDHERAKSHAEEVRPTSLLFFLLYRRYEQVSALVAKKRSAAEHQAEAEAKLKNAMLEIERQSRRVEALEAVVQEERLEVEATRRKEEESWKKRQEALEVALHRQYEVKELRAVEEVLYALTHRVVDAQAILTERVGEKKREIVALKKQLYELEAAKTDLEHSAARHSVCRSSSLSTHQEREE